MLTLVRAVAGSRLYGLNTHESDDDFMGIFVSTEAEKLGLSPIEQVGADDDTMYELSKWVRLAVNGNPTVLQLLWTPESMWVQWDSRWPRIQQDLRNLVLSERCRASFLGYLDGQRKKLINGRGQREELKAKYGYDTKFAMHMIRLAIQGIEVVRDGHMSLPMIDKHRDYLLHVRKGSYTQDECLLSASIFEDVLQSIPSSIPAKVDHDKLNHWMANTYKEFWGWK